MKQKKSLALFITSLMVFSLLSLTSVLAIPQDLDGDGEVDNIDLDILLAYWGYCKNCQADFNEDNMVGVEDLLILLGVWDSTESPDINNDGWVDQLDLDILLDFWGTDYSEADLDSNDNVGTEDLLILLGSWDSEGYPIVPSSYISSLNPKVRVITNDLIEPQTVDYIRDIKAEKYRDIKAEKYRSDAYSISNYFNIEKNKDLQDIKITDKKDISKVIVDNEVQKPNFFKRAWSRIISFFS